jgi:alpha-L-fucosidase
MWFDGANGGDGYYGGKREVRQIDRKTYYDWPTTLEMVRQIQPQVLFFSDAGPDIRWVGNEQGLAGETNWNTITPDTLYPGKADIGNLLSTGSENGTRWIPAEVDVSIRPGWFYHQKEDSLVKSLERLFEIYLTSVGRGSVLLLNVPPDRRGLIHENDVKSLVGFKHLRDSVFADNLAKNAAIEADNVRGKSKTYAAKNLIDGDKDSYWATDDNTKTASFVIDLKDPKQVSYVVLQEYIKLGQRVKSFAVEAWENNQWQQIAQGTTIGYKRILKIDPIETQKIKVTIRDSKACLVLSNVEIF